jgi:hypothetical protein
VSGATGDNALISLASATSESTSSKTLGITAESIATDAFGYVIEAGYLTDIDTSATTAGAAVWLGNTPGSIVFVTPPAEPSHAVYLGVVVRVQSNNGSILVKVQNGYELDELHDVFVGGVSTALPLVYNSTSSAWVAQALTSVGIADNAVVAAKIDAGAVTSAKIADDAVVTSKIIDSAVTSSKLADGSVVAAKISAGAVGSAAIASGAVNTSAINSGAATTSQVLTANGSGGASFQTVSAGISAATFTAKGDILTSSASGVVSVLGVGTNGSMLSVDSTAASGLRYASLAVLQNPDTTTFLNSPSFPSYGQTGNRVATDGTQVVAVDNSAFYTLSGDGTTWIKGSFISASVDTGFNGLPSIAYGNGRWLISYSVSGSFGLVRVRTSTNLATWTDVFSWTGGNNTSPSSIFYCDASTPTFIVQAHNPNTNPNNYPVTFFATNGVSGNNQFIYQAPYYEGLTEMAFSKSQNRLYTFFKPYNSSAVQLRSWIPNGSSAPTADGSIDFSLNNSTNEANPSIIAMDAHSAVYFSYAHRTGYSTNTPFTGKLSYPISGTSTTSDLTNILGNLNTNGRVSKFIASGSNNSALISISNGSTSNTVSSSIISPAGTVSSNRVVGGSFDNNEGYGQRFSYGGRDVYFFNQSAFDVDPTSLDRGMVSYSASTIKRISCTLKESTFASGFSNTPESGAGLGEYRFGQSAQGNGWGARIAINATSSYNTATVNAATQIGNIDIIGGSSGLIWYRNSDTTTFTEGSSGFAGTTVNGLASSGSVAVAVGDSGKVASSTNGNAWTIQTSGVTTSLKSVAFGSGKFVAVGSSGTMIRSSDGSTWTSISGPFSTTQINSVSYNAKLSLFVAGANGGLLASSADGISWTLRTSGTSANINNVASGISTFTIAFVQPSTSTPTFRYSYDAVTWTSVTMPNIGITTTDSFVVHVNAPNPFYLLQFFSSGGSVVWSTTPDARTTLGNGSVVIL